MKLYGFLSNILNDVRNISKNIDSLIIKAFFIFIWNKTVSKVTIRWNLFAHKVSKRKNHFHRIHSNFWYLQMLRTSFLSNIKPKSQKNSKFYNQEKTFQNPILHRFSTIYRIKSIFYSYFCFKKFFTWNNFPEIEFLMNSVEKNITFATMTFATTFFVSFAIKKFQGIFSEKLIKNYL